MRTAWRQFISGVIIFGGGLFAQSAPSVPPIADDDGWSIDDRTVDAFGHPLPRLSAEDRRKFSVGNSIFRNNWVTAPSSTEGRDGLGPLFNARSCGGCHAKDGRSRPDLPGEEPSGGLLIRIGEPTQNGPDRPHPIYGDQIQDSAILEVTREARIAITYRSLPGKFADGKSYELAAPEYRLIEPAYGEIGGTARLGPRVAPQLVGVGLIEAVPDSTILSLADPDDRDGDGISGRVHILGKTTDGKPIVGRFGWKATQPSLLRQIAAALSGDIGITSDLFPNENLTAPQFTAVKFASGGQPEIDALKLERLVYYCRTLAVPRRRDVDFPEIVRGRDLFGTLGCARCHLPELLTADDADVAELRGQKIHPFTDLLLHDMGPDLADQKRDGDASPSEWRTPPLWGMGLVKTVNRHERFLHDGRARNAEEAVLWHGGEAKAAAVHYRRLPATDRSAVIAFLESL